MDSRNLTTLAQSALCSQVGGVDYALDPAIFTALIRVAVNNVDSAIKDLIVLLSAHCLCIQPKRLLVAGIFRWVAVSELVEDWFVTLT